MAITNYSQLKTAISDFMAREDLSGNTADFITLAEARLNRLLKPSKTDATLTGAVGNRAVDISALSIVEPIALFVVSDDGDEREVTQKADGTFPYVDDAGEPSFWAIDGDAINFDCPLDEAYSFRFRYVARLALSATVPVNELLTNHPDVYLAASIVWGGIYIKDDAIAVGYKSLLDEFIAETQHQYAQEARGVLTPDRALSAATRGVWW